MLDRDARQTHGEGTGGGGADPGLFDLSRPMSIVQERELARAVPRCIERIRLGGGRRQRRASRGRIWLRRVYRESLAHGGVPFHLPRRRRRPRPPSVVLLVDVSFSVARAAGYFLWLAAEFVRLGRRTRVLLFVDRPVDATAVVRQWVRVRSRAPGVRPRGRPVESRRGCLPSRQPFSGLLRTVPGLNPEAPSDYGRALHRLLRPDLRPGGRETLLVVLGDARSNRFDPQAWVLEELARRARGVLWLVPEPAERWGGGDSALAEYLPFIDVLVEAWNLNGLERGIRELLRSVR